MDRFRKIMFRFLHFFRDNALALASLSIAVMGLYLTITAQRDEREHKELLLRPALNVEAQADDYSVAVVNLGLGPALITDTVFYLDGRCTAVNMNNVDHLITTNFRDLSARLAAYFIDPFSKIWTKSEWKTSATGYQALTPLPSQIYAVGRRYPLFSLAPDVLADVNSKLNELSLQTRQSFKYEFVQRATSIPMTIRYCSMSGRYCGYYPWADLPCKVP